MNWRRVSLAGMWLGLQLFHVRAAATSQGTDTVNASFTYTLATNVENLNLTGTTAINGTGNTSANVLVGNSCANTLTGNAGNDTLDGKASADALVGGTGNDTYKLSRGYGADTITENDATAGTPTWLCSIPVLLWTNFGS